jgi:hypothetical protein
MRLLLFAPLAAIPTPPLTPDEYWLLKWTLYELWRSPRHWYDKINAILQSIGLTPLLEDPCLYTE